MLRNRQFSIICYTLNYLIKQGVFYDDTYENIEDIVSYSVKIVNMNLKNSTFSFDYSIIKVEDYNAYTLTKICKLQIFHKKS